jgi:ferritin-like metal-binding protein YciE
MERQLNAHQIEVIQDLFHCEVAVQKACEDIMKAIQTGAYKDKIRSANDAHRDHMHYLSNVIYSQTGQTPEVKRDMKGMMLDLYTSLRKLTSEKGALEAFHTAETMVSKKYDDMLREEEFPDDVQNELLSYQNHERGIVNQVQNWLNVA